ncbi:PREDICTED: structural maintenance of chromosomes protein 5-like [Acropora digitifera]|uniref:structural maintenance of chromosomes protein 5-like n=1 Tax=Acropora digitifera TaxID=70779 RepID=UPI00077A45E0|nr:PREDICTED: structural maintenance of chromosomes protein 5-like [Acropora digitifera]
MRSDVSSLLWREIGKECMLDLYSISHRCHDTKKREPQMSGSIRSHLASKKKGSSMMNGQERTTGFVDGAIVRVKMRNFVTYTDCEFKPGPHLNVVLGPNGTGKSSIVCAICLGLAGHTKLLGRATEVRDFIKHGHAQAMIEIELHNSDGRNHIITRDMYRTENRSNWKINGKGTTMKEVMIVTSACFSSWLGFAIRGSSLRLGAGCQWKDKVAEFAKMTQQQLLEATEKAVGPPDMFDVHQKLIDLRKHEKELEVSLRNNREHLEKLEQQNERLEQDVKRYQERERHLKKVQILEKKRPWAEYESARKLFVEMKSKKDEVKRRLEEIKRQSAPMQMRLDEVTNRARELEESSREMIQKSNAALKKAKAKSEQIEKRGDRIEELQGELKDLKEGEKERQKKLIELERTIQGLQSELDALPDPSELQPHIDEINNQARQKKREVTTIQNQARGVRDDSDRLKVQVQDIKSRIAQLEDMKNRRLEFLRNRHRETYNAVMWLRENQHKFSGPVYEPILLQVEMKNVKDAKFIESLISQNDLKSFVCSNRDDLKLFLDEVRDGQGLAVNGVAPPNVALESFKPSRSLKDIGCWGFYGFMKDLFTAPDEVMCYLCSNYNLHDIPLGNDWTEKNAAKVIDEAGVRVFCTPSSKYTVKRSNYGNRERSTLVNHINQKELTSQTQRRRTLENNLETKQKHLETSQQAAPNIEEKTEKIKEEIININRQRAQLAVEYKESVQECTKVAKERIMQSLQQVQVTVEKSKIEEMFRETSQLLKNHEAEYCRISEMVDGQKKLAKNFKKVAHEKTGVPDGTDIPDELKEAFKLYPDTLEELDEMIHDEKARIECQYQSSPQVVKEYERRKKEITNLRSEVEGQEQDLESGQREIASHKERWLTPLKELVSRINEKYGEFFRLMGCAGEVDLSLEQGENNFDKYGIQIKVKFRAKDSLHVLTPFHQSGGERSVSTMLYLMALQELTKCPFRVVDEINQGMDPNNERRVFELVVETACRPNTSQYFLITPKLLPDLTYTNRMTILCVFNGPDMVKHTEWNIGKFIERKKALQV